MRHLLLSGLTLALLLLGALEGHPSGAVVPRVPPLPPRAHPPPAGEPELAILQYVVDHHPSLTCNPIGGTPGHRSLTCSSSAGHDTTGYVDNYGPAPAAQAAWQQRRTQAQAYFPYFADQFYAGYPAYDAHDDNYPYAYWDNYLWGSIWVMGARRHDDTHFRYAPDIAPMIYDAALALGYLGNPTPTPTSPPP